MPSRSVDLIVVGAGVLGCSCAYAAARRGMSVLLFERNPLPADASIRNFGLVIPSAMEPGVWRQRGRRSVDVYRELASVTGIPLQTGGTLYLAMTDFEVGLLTQHARTESESGTNARFLDRGELQTLNPLLEPRNVQGGLLFPDDIRIEPRKLFSPWINHLQSAWGGRFLGGQQVVSVIRDGSGCRVTTSTGEQFRSRRVCLCSGHEQRTLFPHLFAQQPLRYCKLHMLRTRPLPAGRLKTAVASPRSLQRYPAFQSADFPPPDDVEFHRQLDQWGIHVWMVQDPDGRIVLGDSHEYSDSPPDDLFRSDIENLILRYAAELSRCDDMQIESRWIGVYLQHEQLPVWRHELDGRVQLVTGLGGKGMTVSPGLAEELADDWLQDCA